MFNARTTCPVLTLALISITLLCALPAAHAQPPVPERAAPLELNGPMADDPEVLDGAPLHEAFARPLVLEAEAIVIDRKPPEPIEELPPEERPDGKNVHWLPGYWNFDEERNDFVWISGLWRDFPPGRTWVPGEWQPVDTGFQWIAGYWAEEQNQPQPLLPLPPPTLEVGPSSPAPGNNFLWAPGCWQWQGATYAWQPGYWYAAQPNWVWVPSHYSYTPRGVLFVRGYWDYPLVRRGLLYAPVYWGSGYRFGVGIAYRPRTFINTNLLITNLFLDHRHGRYYCGRRWTVAANTPSWLTPWGTNSFSRYGRHHGRAKLYDPLYSHFRWDGHAKNVHGKVRHQDLAVRNHVTRTTKSKDLFRSLDRLTVAERKSLKLQRNNAQELTKFRKETAKYQQFNRSQLVRDQLAQDKNKTQGPNPRGKQLAGGGKPTAKQKRINGQRTVDRTLTNKARTNTRIGDIKTTPSERTTTRATTRPQENRQTAGTRTRVDSRVKTANNSPTEQLRRNAQLRRDAQLRSEAMRNSSRQRQQTSNFQSQLLQRQEMQRDLRRSSIPRQTTGNQTVQRNLGSLYKQRGITSETLTRSKLAQPSVGRSSVQRSPVTQSMNHTRQSQNLSQLRQRTTKPTTTVSPMRTMRSNPTTTQRARTNYRPSTRRAMPTTQPSTQTSGRSSMQRSRNLSPRNMGQQMQSRLKSSR